MQLTEKGFENLKEVCHTYLGIKISRKFLDDNYSEFSDAFSTGSYTFEEECNDGGIFDTCCRESVTRVISEILIGQEWPLNMDSQEYKDKFYSDIREAIEKHSDLEFVE